MNDITKDTIGALTLMGFLLFLYYLYNWKCVEYEPESPVDDNTRRNTRTSTVWTSLSKRKCISSSWTSSNSNKTVLTLVPFIASRVLCLLFIIQLQLFVKLIFNCETLFFRATSHELRHIGALGDFISQTKG